MSDIVSLSSIQLIIDRASPTEKFLNDAFRPRSERFLHNDSLHQIEFDIIDERFFWLYSNFGKALPHRDIIINIDTGNSSENPRSTRHIEPLNQFFMVYDSRVGVAYVSSVNKKGFLTDFFRKIRPEAEIDIKYIYATIDEFIEKISVVESIKFTGYRNLFSHGGDLMEPVSNIFGYNEPEEFTIEAEYKKRNVALFVNQLRNLWKKQQETEIQNLVCIGRDDNGFEAIFNTQNFINKIHVPAEKDIQDLYSVEEVKVNAIQKIRSLNDV